ncbi:hypothetical protein FIBSPDRAFT_897568 [Athelia psychrophila]|uniref:Uncharacterized protein n=1 Tax=Athelia psychrophila TaxID=1759441 RepID=A0A166C0Z1_9AGAM|nr:hypothetical protein FIBSPDRAFT_897568 [Fibularhizoctonia sp. CBS 109695]
MDAGIRACNAAWGGDIGFVEPLRLRSCRCGGGTARERMTAARWGSALCTSAATTVFSSTAASAAWWPGSVQGAPTRHDSRECGQACKEFWTGKEAVLCCAYWFSHDWDGAVAAGASVHALARHWQGVQHRCDELARTVRSCWECELNELVERDDGGDLGGGGSVGHRVGAMLGKWDCEHGGWSAQGAESHPVAALIRAASTGTAREARECLLGFRSERTWGNST